MQPLQPVDADIGRAELGCLDPVAHPLEGSEHLVEDPAVVRLVGIEHDGARLAGHGLLQHHARRDAPRPPETRSTTMVRPLSGVAVNDDDRAFPQVWADASSPPFALR